MTSAENAPASVGKTDGTEAARKKRINAAGKWKLVAGTVCLLVFSLVFNAALSLSSLDKLYLESLASRYREVGEELRQDMEETLRQAGTVGNISDINHALKGTRARIIKEIAKENHVSVSLVLADGTISHSTDERLVGKRLSEEIPLDDEASHGKNKDFRSPHKYEDSRVLSLPIRNREDAREATLLVLFNEKQVRDIHDAVLGKNIRAILVIIGFGAVFLLISNLLILRTARNGNFPKKKISAVIFLIVVLSQIALSAMNMNEFRVHSQQVGTDLAKMGAAESISSGPLQEMVLDSLTVLVISVFFFGEMLILFFQLVEKRLSGSDQRTMIHHSAIRPAFFLLLFGLDVSVSFVPLYMETLYEPFLGFSKDMVMTFSVSMFVFFAGISFLIAGAWNDRRGWYEPFFSGAFLACAGHFYAWIAPNALHFIISRGISGTGYGLFFMASQGFIISYTDKSTKARGFALLFAALYSGNICGSATGAMLAERIGYSPVFFIGAVIMVFALAYTVVFMRNTIRKPEKHVAEKPMRSVSMKQVFHFVFNRNVFTLILLSSIPANMAMIGFTEYFNPVYLNRIGISQSNIGRIFMIYGFFQIYIGPLISRYVDASENKKTYIVAGGVLGGLAFLAFHIFEGIAASMATILLLGFSQSFVFVAQATYLLKLRVSKELGEGKSIAIFRSANRIGQTVGPILFGWLIVAMDVSRGLVCIGLFYLFITVVFLLLAQSDKKLTEVGQAEW